MIQYHSIALCKPGEGEFGPGIRSKHHRFTLPFIHDDHS